MVHANITMRDAHEMMQSMLTIDFRTRKDIIREGSANAQERTRCHLVIADVEHIWQM